MTSRVLITTAYLYPGDEVDQLLRASGLDTVHSKIGEHAAPLTELVAEADAIIAGLDPFTAEVIDAAPRLRVISRTGVGYDSVDIAAATRNGVAVTCTPGANARSVAEHALALMFSCARLLPQNIAGIRAGGWPQPSGRELAGATLGILGLGSIGRLLAGLARALDMDVIAHDPRLDDRFLAETGCRSGTFEEVLRESDFLSLHIFLDDSTRHLIDARALKQLKPTAYLINTARGGVIDEEALADALAAGELAGAALDVVESEPLAAGSRLREFDNVIVTAHVAAATLQARARSTNMAAHQVIAALTGETPEHVVNPDYRHAKNRTTG